MFDLLIKNAVIVTVDPDHHVYSNGYIAVNGNIIAAIGSMEELDENTQAVKIIDANDNSQMTYTFMPGCDYVFADGSYICPAGAYEMLNEYFR